MPGPDGLLSPAEFAAHPASRRPGASYPGYRRYVLRTRARRAAGRQARAMDPLLPTPPGELERSVRAQLKATTDPLIENVLGDTDRAAAGITRLTDTYADRLGSQDDAVRGVYDRRLAEAAGLTDALSNRLGAAGDAEAQSLAAALGKASAPAGLTQGLTEGAAATGRGAANAAAARGSADVQALLSRAAGAEEYAALMPGFARMEGLQAVGRVRGEGLRQTREIRAGIPALLAELMQAGTDRELDKAIAREGIRGERDALTRPDPTLSNVYGYVVDANGNPIPGPDGQVQVTYGAAQDTAAATKEKTEAKAAAVKKREDALRGARASARKTARELFKGKTVKVYGDPYRQNATGQRVERPSWPAAFAQVMAEIDATGLQARFALKPAALQAIVREALARAGFRNPAGGGL